MTQHGAKALVSQQEAGAFDFVPCQYKAVKWHLYHQEPGALVSQQGAGPLA